MRTRSSRATGPCLKTRGQPQQPVRPAAHPPRGGKPEHRARGGGARDEPPGRDRPARGASPRPTVGVITNVGTAHIENLGSQRGDRRSRRVTWWRVPRRGRAPRSSMSTTPRVMRPRPSAPPGRVLRFGRAPGGRRVGARGRAQFDASGRYHFAVHADHAGGGRSDVRGGRTRRDDGDQRARREPQPACARGGLRARRTSPRGLAAYRGQSPVGSSRSRAARWWAAPDQRHLQRESRSRWSEALAHPHPRCRRRGRAWGRRSSETWASSETESRCAARTKGPESWRGRDSASTALFAAGRVNAERDDPRRPRPRPGSSTRAATFASETHAEEEVAERALAGLEPGDRVLVKGSRAMEHGARRGPLARGIRRGDAKPRCSTTCSTRWSGDIGAFNVFRYITFRTGAATLTALFLARSCFGPPGDPPALRSCASANPSARSVPTTSRRRARRRWAAS